MSMLNEMRVDDSKPGWFEFKVQKNVNQAFWFILQY